MIYFKMNGVDFSKYVAVLKVGKTHNFKSMVNASGNTLVKYQNTKRSIEVGFIHMNEDAMQTLLKTLGNLQVTISYREPLNKDMAENVKCINTTQLIEYYTIREDEVSYKPFSLTFTEL